MILEAPRVLKYKFLVSLHLQLDALQYVLWNRLSRVCVQVYTIRPRSDVSIFVENAKVFFSVFQKLSFHKSSFCVVFFRSDVSVFV